MSKIAFCIKWEKEKEQLSFPSPAEKMLPQFRDTAWLSKTHF
jgi:hypothetical protein